MTRSKKSVLSKDLLTAPTKYRIQWKHYRIVVASFATNTGQAANSHNTELLNVPLSVTPASINNHCFSSYWSFAHLDKRLHGGDLSQSRHFLVFRSFDFQKKKMLCKNSSLFVLMNFRVLFAFLRIFWLFCFVKNSVYHLDTKRICFR